MPENSLQALPSQKLSKNYPPLFTHLPLIQLIYSKDAPRLVTLAECAVRYGKQIVN
jgi:hypothetical protein